MTAVDHGECVVVYPEGTLTRDPDLWPMTGKTGAARIALATGAPLIPLGIWGPQEVLPPYERKFRILPRKTMHVLAGPPVDLSDLVDRGVDTETLRAATDRLMAAITGLVEQLAGRARARDTIRAAPRRRAAGGGGPVGRGRRSCADGAR